MAIRRFPGHSLALSGYRLTRVPSQTEDFLWAVIFSTGGDVSVMLQCGGYSETSVVSGTGAFKLRMPSIGAGGQISATLRRDGAGFVSLVPAGFVFSRRPTSPLSYLRTNCTT